MPDLVIAIEDGTDVHASDYSAEDLILVASPDPIPGNASTTAEIAVGGEARSRIDFPGDDDWFRVELEAGTRYRFWLRDDNSSDDPLADSTLRRYDSDGNFVDYNDDIADESDLNSHLFYTPAEDELVFASASGYRESIGDYVLSVDRDIPSDDTTTAEVAVGGESRSRIDFSGDHDWFRVELEVGKTYRFELRGDGLSEDPLADPFLYLNDSESNFIASDDNSGSGYDSRLFYTPAEDELVFAGARGDFGGHTGDYVLSVDWVMV